MSSDSTKQAPMLPITGRDTFRVLVTGLHGAGAIVAAVFCFLCDAEKSKQRATVPFALPLAVSPLSNMSHARASRTAFPWGEDDTERFHSWNPFLLVMAFEWLTAGYAMCKLGNLIPGVVWAAMLWLAVGLSIVITWCSLHVGIVDANMPILVTLSFGISAALCFKFSSIKQKFLGEKLVHKTTPLITSVMDGRTWLVPRSITGLKAPTGPIFKADDGTAELEYERLYGVLNRYAEYCVTAPLLFVAVTCLLVTDAPSWLFISGYFFLVGCNLFGFVLHCTTMYMQQVALAKKNDDPVPYMTWTSYIFDSIYTGTWRSTRVKQLYLLESAWLCLMLPMAGLVYATRGYLLSAELPTLVAFIIWNLLLTYSLFGIIPTFIYITGRGFDQLDLILDALNVVAKFPIPMQILYGFIARPAGVHPCFS